MNNMVSTSNLLHLWVVPYFIYATSTIVTCFVLQPQSHSTLIPKRHTPLEETSLSSSLSFGRIIHHNRVAAAVLCASENNDNTESAFPWEDALPADDNAEATLLRLHLSIKEGIHIDNALDQVQKYTQSFPFAAVLPVQPLQYLPTQEGGVDVLFLRKKTKEKGSIDGGMRFFVRAMNDDNDDDDDDDNDESSSSSSSSSKVVVDGIDVLVKRNSKGQSISKMFTEKLVVQAYVQGISGEQDDKTGPAPTEFISVQSVFHPWL